MKVEDKAKIILEWFEGVGIPLSEAQKKELPHALRYVIHKEISEALKKEGGIEIEYEE